MPGSLRYILDDIPKFILIAIIIHEKQYPDDFDTCTNIE